MNTEAEMCLLSPLTSSPVTGRTSRGSAGPFVVPRLPSVTFAVAAYTTLLQQERKLRLREEKREQAERPTGGATLLHDVSCVCRPGADFCNLLWENRT